MKNVFASIIMAGLASIMPTQAFAQFRTGNDILSGCMTAKISDTFYQMTAFCSGYIDGAFDDFMLTRQAAKKPDCTPPNVTSGQVKDIVVKYLHDNPDIRNMSASLLVRMATVTAWPSCGLMN